MISGKTRVCALIGDPVEHSLSPFIHNAAFEHLGLDYVYVVFRVKSEDLGKAIIGIKGLGIHGINVTMPHKIDVIRYLDELDESAKTACSVNTILNDNGKLIGYTTDGAGALMAMKYNNVDPFGKRILILGAGGASRSISFTLAKVAKKIVILNRTVKKAEMLAGNLMNSGVASEVLAFELNKENLEAMLSDSDILINATSIGMNSDTETPVPPNLLRRNLVVFDLVYEPIETRLLRDAKLAGAKTIDGLSMLVHQGAASFEIWTGIKAPIDLMLKVAKRRMLQLEKGGINR
ncbi:MAG: shikimate dehydrogenase [Candidatus Bathyarchaeota archaeon]|nr:shikimate dehydrogenase [Candidatus Bathyarchaeota archaeon]